MATARAHPAAAVFRTVAAALDRVVNDAKVKTEAGDLAVDGGVTEAAVEVHEFEQRRIALVALVGRAVADAYRRQIGIVEARLVSLPRELRGRRAVAGAVANIEEALQCAESDFAVRRAFECQMRRLDEIKEVFVPNVHLDDTPATGKSLGEGGKLCHQPFSAMSFGNRTRL